MTYQKAENQNVQDFKKERKNKTESPEVRTMKFLVKFSSHVALSMFEQGIVILIGHWGMLSLQGGSQHVSDPCMLYITCSSSQHLGQLDLSLSSQTMRMVGQYLFFLQKI